MASVSDAGGVFSFEEVSGVNASLGALTQGLDFPSSILGWIGVCR